MSNILVTGGSGFLGPVIIQKLLTEGHSIRTISRNEGKLYDLQQKFPEIDVMCGDIADSFTIYKALKDMEGCIHAAAVKFVGRAEKQPMEAVHTNVTGTLNLLKNSWGLEFVLGISTDKTSQVNGVYGATKFLMERLFQEYEEVNEFTNYRIVRYGNVLYSTGSIMCQFRRQIEEGGVITITDPNCTRFFWTVDAAADLVLQCLKEAKDCQPFVPQMKAMSIGNLLAATIEKYGEPDRVDYVGLQPGENLHEKLVEDGPFSNEVDQYTIEEIKTLI